MHSSFTGVLVGASPPVDSVTPSLPAGLKQLCQTAVCRMKLSGRRYASTGRISQSKCLLVDHAWSRVKHGLDPSMDWIGLDLLRLGGITVTPFLN